MESMDPISSSRRNFIAGATALGVTSLFPAFASSEQNSRAGNPRRLDVHHHFIPDSYAAFQKAHGQGGGGGARGRCGQGDVPLQWSLSKDLEDMDKNGTATAILSITTPGFWFGETQEVRKVMRDCNEAAAKLAAEHKGRFGSFAAINMLDTEGAMREMEYALDTLKADGIGLFTSYGDKWLGDESFDPIWQEVN